jgi:hypothetical protein
VCLCGGKLEGSSVFKEIANPGTFLLNLFEGQSISAGGDIEDPVGVHFSTMEIDSGRNVVVSQEDVRW